MTHAMEDQDRADVVAEETAQDDGLAPLEAWTDEHERKFQRGLRELDILTAFLDSEGRWPASHRVQ